MHFIKEVVLTLGMKLYLRPEGNPAPPRPRSPEFLISSMIHSGPMRMSSFVRYQSPRSCAPFSDGSWSPYKLVKILSLSGKSP